MFGVREDFKVGRVHAPAPIAHMMHVVSLRNLSVGL
jgi:hypothetical protein